MARKRRTKELSMRKVREVLRLGLKCNMGNRQIGRSCSISHATVGKYLGIVEEAGLSWSEVKGMDDSELAKLFVGCKALKEKWLHPGPDFGYIHKELKKKSVTLQLLWHEYKENYPDGYQSTQFYELYNKWKKKLDVSMRQVHKAGEKLFVDYAGHSIPVIDRRTGEVKDAQVFVAVLGASNYTYAEATFTQSISDWIGSHIRSFEYFGGVSEIVVPDNLKSGVSKACRYEPDINSTYHDMAVHYGTVVIPARVRKPKDKAKAEVGVQVVERMILAVLRNREFFSLKELNEAIFQLLSSLNSRPFKKLEGSRLSWFETVEKEALKPLPRSRYEFAEWKKAGVNIDYHVELKGHYYSVPYELCHERVDIRYTQTTVEVFFKGKRVASHARDDSKGRYTTVKEHMPKSHREYLEWTPSRIIRWAGAIGKATAQVVEAIIKSRSHPVQGYRSCLGIIRLGKRYNNDRLELACKRALYIRGTSYSSIKSILEKGLDKVPLPEEKGIDKTIVHNNLRGSGYYKEDKNVDSTNA